jgi:hypothetical protein
MMETVFSTVVRVEDEYLRTHTREEIKEAVRVELDGACRDLRLAMQTWAELNVLGETNERTAEA